MPADLVANDAIPQLATQIDSPAALRVLRHLREAGFIQNDAANPEIAKILERLADLGLVDPGYAKPVNGKPFIWVSSGNGARVTKYFETSEGQAQGPKSKLKIAPLAQTGLASLSDMDRLKVLVAAETLSSTDPAIWPPLNAELLGYAPAKLPPPKLRRNALPQEPEPQVRKLPVYVLRTLPDLHIFLRILDSGEIELNDIISEETLRWVFGNSHAESSRE